MRSLQNLKIGEKSTVISTKMKENQKRRILDLGIINGTQIEAIFKSPSGDPTAYEIRGSVIAIRSEDAKKIFII